MKFKKLLCLLLAAFTLLSFAACNEPSSSSTTGTTTGIPVTEPDPEPPVDEPLEFSITSSYVVVRPDDRTPDEVSALKLLCRGIKSAYGFDVDDTTDFLRYNEEVKPNEFEILIGPTNRQASEELYSELSYYDWCYKIISPNVVAICGGSPEATLTAAEEFLSDVLGYKEYENKVISSGNAATLLTGTTKTYRHIYNVKTLTIENVDASQYKIVADSKFSAEVQELVDAFNKLSGVRIPVVSPEEYTDGPAIFFGMANESRDHLELSSFGTYRYYVMGSNGNLIFDFKTAKAAKEAVESFTSQGIPKSDGGNVNISAADLYLTGISVPDGTNSLKLESGSSSTVANGIIYEERLYLDPDGKPVRVYILTVKNGAATIATSMPNDGTASGKVSNIKNQLTSAASNGKNVIAGINADFFDMGGTNVMRGLCIKDGKLIHEPDGRPWFGITGDGKAVVGSSSDYTSYKNDLVTAVGGSDILIKGDELRDLDVGTEFADTRHPRTAVGIKPNGDIVLMVVDGRQSSISNGATLADLADLFGSLGCTEAINLDGGGSSTFILKEKGSFNTKNSPSAGSLRAVANGLMVILP